MPATDTFLGLDGVAWTALATIAALLIAVVPLVYGRIVDRINRPVVELATIDAPTFSSEANSFFNVRVPVWNKGKAAPATNVDVLVEKIEGEARFPKIPMRLSFAHTGDCEARQIAAGTFRLLDVLAIQMHPEPVFGGPGALNATLVGEGGDAARQGLVFGEATVHLLISADGLGTRRESIRIRRTGEKHRPVVAEPGK